MNTLMKRFYDIWENKNYDMIQRYSVCIFNKIEP